MANMTKDSEMFAFLRDNPSLLAEIPYSKVRAMARKLIKPQVKDQIMKYYKIKLMGFKAQRECFKHLMKFDASMKCASMNADFSKFADAGKVHIRKGGL